MSPARSCARPASQAAWARAAGRASGGAGGAHRRAAQSGRGRRRRYAAEHGRACRRSRQPPPRPPRTRPRTPASRASLPAAGHQREPAGASACARAPRAPGTGQGRDRRAACMTCGTHWAARLGIRAAGHLPPGAGGPATDGAAGSSQCGARHAARTVEHDRPGSMLREWGGAGPLQGLAPRTLERLDALPARALELPEGHVAVGVPDRQQVAHRPERQRGHLRPPLPISAT